MQDNLQDEYRTESESPPGGRCSGDTRQGAAEVFTETRQTAEFVTDLKYVMGQTSPHHHHRQCHHCGQLWC